MTKSPCKGCLDRTITCHTMCRRYQEWKSVHEKEVEQAKQAKKDNMTIRDISDIALRRYWKSLRYHRSKQNKR